MTAQNVVDRIRETFGDRWRDSPLDAFVAGRPDTPVTGIATSFAASLQVLRRAAAANRNLIITREHVFYSHGRAPAAQAAGRWKDDPAGAVKQEIIDRHQLVIWRFIDNWDRRPDNPQLSALAKALGWEQRRIRDAYFALQPDTLSNVARAIQHRLHANGIRVIGNPQTRVSKVAVAPGLMLVPQLRTILQEPGVDAVVIGEPVEWEAAPYFQDVVASGQKKGMIILGQAVSEEPGCGEMASWLKQTLGGIAVDWIPAGEPFQAATEKAQ